MSLFEITFVIGICFAIGYMVFTKTEYKISFTVFNRKHSIEKGMKFEGCEMYYITEYGVEKYE